MKVPEPRCFVKEAAGFEQCLHSLETQVDVHSDVIMTYFLHTLKNTEVTTIQSAPRQNLLNLSLTVSPVNYQQLHKQESE